MAALGVERGTLLMPQQLGFEREAEHVLELARDRAALAPALAPALALALAGSATGWSMPGSRSG